MKLNANKSLHCTDYEIVCDRFFGCFTPGKKPQSLNYDFIFAVKSELELWASAGGKAAEKNSATNHFVISAMQAFVCTKFHVILSQNFLL